MISLSFTTPPHQVHDAEDADVDEGPAVVVRAEVGGPGEVGEQRDRVEGDEEAVRQVVNDLGSML
jgi:hypothetical protein